MSRIRRSLVSFMLVPAFLAPTLALAADGKAVFLDKKCNKCHTVSSASIEKTSKLKGPDLTTEAIKGDAKLLKGYLKKHRHRRRARRGDRVGAAAEQAEEVRKN
jgi:cytochrome c551/c552